MFIYFDSISLHKNFHDPRTNPSGRKVCVGGGGRWFWALDLDLDQPEQFFGELLLIMNLLHPIKSFTRCTFVSIFECSICNIFIDIHIISFDI